MRDANAPIPTPMTAEVVSVRHEVRRSTPTSRRAVIVVALCGLTIAASAIQSTTISQLAPPSEHFRAWLTAPLAAGLLAICARDLAARVWRLGPVTFLTAWVGWSFVSAMLGDDIAVSLAYSLAYAGVGAAMITISERLGWSGICATFVWAGVCYAAVAAIAPLLSDRYAATEEGRLQLLSLEANQLGRICAIVILAALYLAVRGPRGWSFPAIVVLCIAAWGLFETNSRTALGGLLAALGLIALSYLSKRARIALAGLAAAAIICGFVLGIVDTDLDWLSRNSDASADVTNLSGRTTLWPSIVEGSMERPIAGHGMGFDGAFMSQLRHDGEISFVAPHAHSIVLHPLITTGIVGLIMFGGALVTSIGRAFVRFEPWRDSMLLLLVIDGFSEAVIRVPSFGWAALMAVAAQRTDQASSALD
jgi:O-antigen ligase